MQTYLFYDIETTGLNKSFDQVLQFAAIRTDLELNEISRHEHKIKLNADMTPSPYAMITHLIDIKEAQAGLHEIEAIHKIHQLMNTPGTITVGYNTLGFDDEFLRFSFYRNLLPPYTHQFANGCSRMDMYPFAIMYFLFKNSILQWPLRDHKISLKLDLLNSLNKLAEGQAHNAMVDVEATLALAKLFYADTRMWNYMCGFFNKSIDEKRMLNLTDRTGLMIYGKLGIGLSFQTPVLHLGTHRHYKNQNLWLRLDTETLTSISHETISENTWVIRKRLAEPGFILPLTEPYTSHLNPERRLLVNANRKWLSQNPELLTAICDYHTNFKYPVIPNTDIEARLYMNGFLNLEDERFCKQFHASSVEQKVELTHAAKNPTLKSLATRILGRLAPHLLSGELLEEYNAYLQQETVVDYRGNARLTPKTALSQILELRTSANLSHLQLELLLQLENYLSEGLTSAKPRHIL